MSDQQEARVPRYCPFCGWNGAFDGQGCRIEEFERFCVNPDAERSRETVTQEWYRHHCPDCGELFATCRETTTPLNHA